MLSFGSITSNDITEITLEIKENSKKVLGTVISHSLSVTSHTYMFLQR
jgi:hypothetical protein